LQLTTFAAQALGQACENGNRIFLRGLFALTGSLDFICPCVNHKPHGKADSYIGQWVIKAWAGGNDAAFIAFYWPAPKKRPGF
jgi:hypothetical protein